MTQCFGVELIIYYLRERERLRVHLTSERCDAAGWAQLDPVSIMAPGAQLNSPLPAMGSSDPTPLPPASSSQASEPLRGLRRYKMINLVGDGTYGLVYLAYNQV